MEPATPSTLRSAAGLLDVPPALVDTVLVDRFAIVATSDALPASEGRRGGTAAT